MYSFTAAEHNVIETTKDLNLQRFSDITGIQYRLHWSIPHEIQIVVIVLRE